jgi:hypothetical protein
LDSLWFPSLLVTFEDMWLLLSKQRAPLFSGQVTSKRDYCTQNPIITKNITHMLSMVEVVKHFLIPLSCRASTWRDVSVKGKLP